MRKTINEERLANVNVQCIIQNDLDLTPILAALEAVRLANEQAPTAAILTA